MSAKPRHWAEWNEVTFVAGIRLLFVIHRRLGRWPFLLCLWPVVISYWAFHRPARQASQAYLRRWAEYFQAAKPPSSLAHFLRFADVLLDKLLASSGQFPSQRLRYGDLSAVRACMARGQGGVMITAHVGCLELCQAAAEWVPGLQMNVLVHTRHAENFNALLRRLRPHSRLRLLQVTEIGPATAMALAERIAAGEFVAIVGDRVPVGGGRTAQADFLGHPAEFPLGPWILAGLLRCPVFLLSCRPPRPGDPYRIEVEPLAERIELPRAARQAVLQQWVQRYAEWLQDLIRHSPCEWFNFFDFWSQRGESARSAH